MPRNGIKQLLEALRHSGKTLTVCSDAGEDKIVERLGDLVGYFAGIYGHDNLVYKDGTQYKNLGRICREAGIRKERAVFVGDNHKGLDQRSAEKYGIKYIMVPDALKDKEYDFSQLIERL